MTDYGALGDSSRLFRITVQREIQLSSGRSPPDGPDCSHNGQEAFGRTFKPKKIRVPSDLSNKNRRKSYISPQGARSLCWTTGQSITYFSMVPSPFPCCTSIPGDFVYTIDVFSYLGRSDRISRLAIFHFNGGL